MGEGAMGILMVGMGLILGGEISRDLVFLTLISPKDGKTAMGTFIFIASIVLAFMGGIYWIGWEIFGQLKGNKNSDRRRRKIAVSPRTFAPSLKGASREQTMKLRAMCGGG